MFVAEQRHLRTVGLTATSLRKLRKRLPRGYQTKVVAELGGKYSRGMVGMVATGKRYNAEVITAMIRVAENAHTERAAMVDAIKKL